MRPEALKRPIVGRMGNQIWKGLNMAIEDQIERLERITPLIPPCRCCGKALSILDGITDAVREGVGIHTRCIPKHWGKHSKHINNARCKEFQVEGGIA
jgi:hypothetical protein